MWDFFFHLTFRDRRGYSRSPVLLGDSEKPRQNSGKGPSLRRTHSWLLRRRVRPVNSDHCRHRNSEPATRKNGGDRSLGGGITSKLSIRDGRLRLEVPKNRFPKISRQPR